MAAQAALIADTVAGMRRAVADHHDTSDSDDSFYGVTNRGNKLKRKSQYVREGQLDMPSGPKVYKRKIEHAGHKRYIIHRNPRRYDEDGNPLDDDEVDEQADADAAARNPYHEIRLKDLLGPLTSAADLPTHPSMSIPYKSSTLSDMVQHASELLHRERKTLWNMKQMLTKLRGDETWIPCGALNSDVDDVIFDTGPIYKEIIESELLQNFTPSKGPALMNGEAVAQTYKQPGAMKNSGPSLFSIAGTRRNSDEKIHETSGRNTGLGPPSGPGSELAVSAPADAVRENQQNPGLVHGKKTTVEIKEELLPTADRVLHESGLSERLTADVSRSLDFDNRSTHVTAQSTRLGIHEEHTSMPDSAENRPQPGPQEALVTNGEGPTMTDNDVQPNATAAANEGSIGVDDGADASQAVPHRMQTRAQAQAISENTASSRTRSASPAWTPPVVHPLFLMPASAYPDRNFGLPPGEAEETRRMVTLYAQKQEEVCRSAEKLYVGLLKADRMRKTVFKWCKAEGHVGEMSDGEDWYDKEEWGLDEDLRKGQEEEEEDKDKDKEGTGAQAKKTRKTRVAALK